jgi:hypothetical protein
LERKSDKPGFSRLKLIAAAPAFRPCNGPLAGL